MLLGDAAASMQRVVQFSRRLVTRSFAMACMKGCHASMQHLHSSQARRCPACRSKAQMLMRR